jgi:hypothetical protein
MTLQGRDSMTADSVGLAAYQGQLRAKPAFGSAALKASLADLWPLTMIALALGLTLAWTGLLVSFAWWGIERLI